jgi:hypothetical protein
MYDKFGRVLRLETTTNDVSFFKHHRRVEHRNGPSSFQLAAIRKTIYSLGDLREVLLGCNRRYLDHLSALDDFSPGFKTLDRLSEPKAVGPHRLKGFNFFDRGEHALLTALQRPEFNLRGLRRKDLKPYLPGLSEATLTRQLRRLRGFRLVKRVAGTYRYYLTRLGRRIIAACASLRELVLAPALARP